MALASGTRIGPYEVTGTLGAGGMGEVYRARDARLARDVALKVLPASFAEDPERLARFQREAQVLAALKHPNIGAIYGLEEQTDAASGVSGTIRALVLELIEGDTLADRIARGPMPVDEALAVAKQIAEALEAAHEQGIIHRDLKPANIKVSADGVVKVLDFGLAKLTEGGSGTGDRGLAGAHLTASPTLTSPALMTGVGMILGTAAYMSPEQAKGLPADARSDIWSFGAVLYEMLCGRPLFAGGTVVEIISGIVKGEPDWGAVPPGVPAPVRTLLRRCLDKERSRRLRHIGDARLWLEDAATAVAPAQAAAPRHRRQPLAWTAAAAVTIAALAAAAAPVVLWTAADAPEMRVDVATPPTPDPISIAMSRDGRAIAFVASGETGERLLWVRRLDADTAQPLAGTEGATYPFWSPSGQAVAFFAGGQLRRVDLAGGAVRTLAEVRFFRGGTWGEQDVILFARENVLQRVSASGGPVTAATTLGDGHSSHRFPQFLPGGRQFLFYVQVGSNDPHGIYLGSIDSPEIRFIAATESGAAYHPAGYLLFVRQGSLLAQRFDVQSASLAGEPVTIAPAVAFQGNFGVGAFSTSETGIVAYRAGGDNRQLVWLDRSGRELQSLGSAEPARSELELSPDGGRAAVTRVLQGNRDVWLVDTARGTPTRLTFGPGGGRNPSWSPDGTRIAFASDRGGVFDLFVKASTGAGIEEPLWASPDHKQVNDWAPDGRSLLFAQGTPVPSDLWILPIGTDAKPHPFVNTPATERYGVFSPDGRWVAYQSDESGRDEIYVQAFAAGGKWQVSTEGGIEARWSPDGRELYYIAPDARLMAVPVTSAGNVFEAATPAALFQTRIALGGTVGSRPQYDIAADGRILMNVAVEAAATTPITLLLNWRPPVED